MPVSVVIPTLNEEECVGQAIASVQRSARSADVVVSDGGSTDDTVARARAKGARVVRADRGRATQMNAGALKATGDVFVFLHADTELPRGAIDAVIRATDEGYEAGIFRLRFDDERSLILRASAAATALPSRRLCFGDRALFISRARFESVGGFPDVPIFEDLELVRRLANVPFVFLQSAVTTSARRFRNNGTARQQLLNARLWLQYQLGASPARLARFYRYGDGRPDQSSS